MYISIYFDVYVYTFFQGDKVWSSYSSKTDTNDRIQNRRFSKIQSSFQNGNEDKNESEKNIRNFTFRIEDSDFSIGENSLLGMYMHMHIFKCVCIYVDIYMYMCIYVFLYMFICI
jgi:hypothetical protein